MPASGRTATPRSKISGRPPTSGSRMRRRTSLRPVGSASSLSVLGCPRSDEELESFHVDLLWVVEIGPDDRIAAWVTFDPNDFEGRHRRARRALPRGRSGRPRAHLVGDHGWPRHGQPARIAPHDTGLREHRPPAGHIIRARRTRRILPCWVRARPRHPNLRRGCASAQRPWSCVYPCRAWHFARRLRCRVARCGPLDGRRRHGQPLRGLRRGGSRRRAREIRSAQPVSTPAGKQGQPNSRTHAGAFRGPRVGPR